VQTQKLLDLAKLFPAEAASFRLLLLSTVFNKISDPGTFRTTIISEMAVSERKRLMARIGKPAWVFTACNPTGEYRLNLSRAQERDVALILVALKNQEQEFAEEEAKRTEGRVGGRRDKEMERIWRNATYNNRPLVYEPTWQLPTQGICPTPYSFISEWGQQVLTKLFHFRHPAYGLCSNHQAHGLA
jgi:hypothetical protein